MTGPSFTQILRLAQDAVSKVLTIISIDHSKIHQGKAFSFWRGATLGADEVVYTHLKTRDKPVHLRDVHVSSDAEKIYMRLVEGVRSVDL